MVNLTNPMMMKGPTREFFPVGEQVVTVAVPQGRRPAAARLLVADSEVNAEAGPDGVLRFRVPCIELIEVLHLEWI
jgi:hypothetical protein